MLAEEGGQRQFSVSRLYSDSLGILLLVMLSLLSLLLDLEESPLHRIPILAPCPIGVQWSTSRSSLHRKRIACTVSLDENRRVRESSALGPWVPRLPRPSRRNERLLEVSEEGGDGLLREGLVNGMLSTLHSAIAPLRAAIQRRKRRAERRTRRVPLTSERRGSSGSL